MAVIKGKVRQGTSIDRGSEGQDQFARMLSDGSLVTVDWKQAMVQEGRAFVITIGAFATPVTGGGQGTVMDLDQPEIVISIPSGTSIWPKRIHVGIQPGAVASDRDETEILVAIDQDKANIGAATPGTATTETIYNLNTLHSRASACTAKTAFVGDATDPVLDIELAHVVRITDIDTVGIGTGWHHQQVGFVLDYEPDAPPKINGPATLLVYWGGTVACLAYATVEWYELPSGS